MFHLIVVDPEGPSGRLGDPSREGGDGEGGDGRGRRNVNRNQRKGVHSSGRDGSCPCMSSPRCVKFEGRRLGREEETRKIEKEKK